MDSRLRGNDCVRGRSNDTSTRSRCRLATLWIYTMRMKRTSLMLDPELLDQARRLLGVKTYSATVNLALAEVLRLRKIRASLYFSARAFGRAI